jgi:hypothetical protein
MTRERVALPFKLDAAEDKQQVPPPRYPGSPVELGGVVARHAPFLRKGANTALSSVAWQEIRLRFGRDDTSVRNGQERVEAVFAPLGWVEMRVAHRSRVIAFESIPQRLKPLFLVGFDGGAEAPPLQKDPQKASRELQSRRET